MTIENKVHRLCLRERDLYFSVVTGTHYWTKTPPDQQPTNPCAGVMRRRGGMISSMVSRGRCLVRYMTWWALLLFVLAVGGVSHWLIGLGGSDVGTVGPWLRPL